MNLNFRHWFGVMVVMVCLTLGGCSHPSEPIDTIKSCAVEFEIPNLINYNFQVLESEKRGSGFKIYHFILVDGQISDMKNILVGSGYENWTRGESSFDGYSYGWREDDLICSEIERDGFTCYVAISEHLREIVFIRYPN